jgi:tRNA dimethylallyltransferase
VCGWRWATPEVPGPAPAGHVALVGVTASGKSRLAARLARARPDAELVSIDSMAVYRGMDIGTAKPPLEERLALRYHLIDLVEPDAEFTLRQFQASAKAALAGIEARRHRALLVGGTALYLRAVVDDLELPGRWPEVADQLEREADGPGGVPALHARLAALDPAAASRMTASNRRRVVRALEVTLGSGRPFSSFGSGLDVHHPSPVRLVGIPFDPQATDRAVEARFRDLLDAGLLEEVRDLAARPAGLSRTARQALGYRELLAHVEQGVALDSAVAEAVRRTRGFARRQWAWFRRDPRIHWLDPSRDLLGQLLEHWDEVADAGRAQAAAVGDLG